jgi:hypothetical protein
MSRDANSEKKIAGWKIVDYQGSIREMRKYNEEF